MICKECGTKFSSGLFCPECGTRVGSVPDSWEEEQTNEQCAGEEYDAKKYGAQGLLEEQIISKEIKIAAGERRVFENKRLIVEKGIYVGENAKVEFRNCSLAINVETAIWAEGAYIDFEYCTISGNGSLLSAYSEKGGKLEFRNCAFMEFKFKSAHRGARRSTAMNYFIELRSGKNDSAYFENCFIKIPNICMFSSSCYSYTMERKLEFRNCIIDNMDRRRGTFIGGADVIVEFNNCYIKSIEKLLDSESALAISHSKPKYIIKNCHFDYYDPFHITP